MSADQFIAARVSSETKSRIRSLAQRQQLSESALLKRLLATTLQVADNLPPADSDQLRRETRVARLYVLKLLRTRQQIEYGWRAVADSLVSQGQRVLAARTTRYADALPLPQTEREWFMSRLLERTREPRVQEQLTR